MPGGWRRRRTNFAAALAEALRDAAGALLRDIDFVGEAANLRDARDLYKFNRRIRVPATIGSGIWMDFRLLSSSRVRTSGDGSSSVTQ